MSINLLKNNEALVGAWTSVVDDKSPTNWAIFGYEGQTNNLKVVGTGDGGLEEMIEDLNSGEIMYAFCRVIDNKTSLPKCVLINWQGEGAPIVRKGTCANHIRDVEKLLKGAHITVNARSDEDVEVDIIMDKLARATGSAYKFREPRGKDVGNSAPVGTVYKRVIPEQEINPTERDEFWQKEEIEEKERIAEEKLRLERERKKKELEERLREEERNKIKEQQYANDDKNIAKEDDNDNDEKSQSDIRIQQLKNIRNQHMLFNQNGADCDVDHKSRSDELRRQRFNETQQLIAQRTINARAVFEQNSAAGQMTTTFNNTHIKKNTVKQTINTINNSSAKVVKEPESKPKVEAESPVEPEPVTIVEKCESNSVKIPTESIQPPQPTVEPPSPEQSLPSSEQETPPSNVQENSTENNIETELYNQLSNNDYSSYFDPNAGLMARALYDYQAADDTEITFNPGDVITNIDTIDEGWWQGLGPDGTYGLFPANYVEVIEE